MCLVDTPGIGLSLDHLNLQTGQKVSPDQVVGVIEQSLTKTDLCILVMNNEDDSQLYDLYFRLLAVIRHKNGLEPNKKRWNDAWKRILIARTKADGLLSSPNSFYEDTWLRTREKMKDVDPKKGFKELQLHLRNIAKRLSMEMLSREKLQVWAK